MRIFCRAAKLASLSELAHARCGSQVLDLAPVETQPQVKHPPWVGASGLQSPSLQAGSVSTSAAGSHQSSDWHLIGIAAVTLVLVCDGLA
jgi:hypothetical protein